MDREIKYNKDAICDVCGKYGAYNVMGDYICYKCLEKENEEFKKQEKEK